MKERKPTVLLKLDLIGLQFDPDPVDDLVRQHSTQEDLAKGDRKGLVGIHLTRN